MGDIMNTTHRIVARLAAGALGFGAIVASPAGAQTATTDAHWQAWVGCWRPTEALGSGPAVCVVPSTVASAVDVVTVDSGKVASRITVDASGRDVAVTRDGCSGTERARWSHDSLRVFLSSDMTCANGLKRTTSGMMSISPNGEWLNVEAVTAANNTVVRAAHYAGVASTAGLPADVASVVVSSRALDARTAVIAAGSNLTAAAIVEVAQALDTAAVQAWIVERHQSFNLNSHTLTMLADAGVPGSVTDAMVAVTYPKEFRFDRAPAQPSMAGLSSLDSARIASDYLLDRGCDANALYSPFGWGLDPCRYYYDPYQSRYGYGYGLGYGYGSPYGYGGYGGYGYYPGYNGYYTGSIVIVRNTENPHGRAVKGRGYTRPSSGAYGGSSSSTYRGGGSQGSSASSGSSGSSSASGSSRSTSGGSSGGGRTAHARPPAN